ncbi:AAA family ATPase [Mycobacterium paragordonae]|uniref:AAA family ATPase n=2 Tax=Mycobacterium TaxID=1763 RepID=UPI0039857C09
MSDVRDDVPTLAWEPKPGYPGIAVGTMVIFGGRPAAGKSTAARWFVAEATTGALPGAWRGTPVGAAWIGTEESASYMIKPGLRAAGADLDKVVIPEVEIRHENDDSTVMPILSCLNMESLAGECTAAGIKVVVLDPLMSAVGARTDVNRSNEVRERLEPWVKLAEAIDGVVIGIAHLKKSFTGDVVAALNGSSAFGEVARSIFGFSKDDSADDGTRLMSHAKSSFGPESLSFTYALEPVAVTTDSGKTAAVTRFVLGEETDRTVSDALREAAAGVAPAKPEDKPLTQKAATLVQILTGPNGALLEVTKDDAVAQMAEAGYSADQTRRAREELDRRCRIGKPYRNGSSGPYYWKLLPFVDPNGSQDGPRTTRDLPSCHPAPDQHLFLANQPQDGKDGRLADSPRARDAATVTDLDSRRSRETGQPKVPCPEWLAQYVAGLRADGHTRVSSFAIYQDGQAEGHSKGSIGQAIDKHPDLVVIGRAGRSKTYSLTGETNGYKPCTEWVHDYLDSLPANTPLIDKDHFRSAAESAGHDRGTAAQALRESDRVTQEIDPNNGRRTIWRIKPTSEENAG